MVQYRFSLSALQPGNWIIAVIGIAVVVALLFAGGHTSETARLEQTATSSAAEITGSGTGK